MPGSPPKKPRPPTPTPDAFNRMYLGVLIYLIAEHNGMAERSERQVQAVQAQQDASIKSVAGSTPADQIAQAKQLLDGGAITQAEFDAIKAKALG